jgi:hypothetical protein
MLEELSKLEDQLRDLSHNQEALELIKDFANKLKKQDRQIIFSAEGSLIIKPIFHQDMLEKGLIDDNEDPFTLLQGDIVSTDSAYLCGERLKGMKFAIASSTCDLVKNRRQYVALLRLQPIVREDPKIKAILGELLKFQSTQRMYLPRLDNDPPDVIANSIVFDGVVQIRLEDLFLATRHASLSLVGWRIFGSLVRTIMVRAGDSEVKMRSQSS